MSQPFANQSVIVTRAATGIGRATALAFAGQGAHVVAVDSSVLEAEKTVRLIHEYGGEVLPIACDVSSPDDVRNLVQKNRGRLGAAQHGV